MSLALAQGGCFAATQALRAGIPHQHLRSMVRAGELCAVRRGAYVIANGYVDATPEERYRLRVLAVLRTRPPEDCASHQAALAVYGAPLLDVDLERIDVCGASKGVNARGGVVIHPMPPGVPLKTALGLRFIAPAVAVAQLSVSAGVMPAIVAADGLLRAGVVTLAEVTAAVSFLPTKWHTRYAEVVRGVDPNCESVGESRTRMLLVALGIPFRTQVRIMDLAGRVVARVDFLLWEVVVLEFDGLVKYEGADGKVALVAEKLREERLVELGYEVVRMVWRDHESPTTVHDRLLKARARQASRGRSPVGCTA